MPMNIMISSTVKDLKYLREQIGLYIQSCGHTAWVSGSSTFPHICDDAMKNCIKAAEQCDRLIVILGKRAGLLFNKSNNITITEAEYNAAKKAGKPILGFVESDVWHDARIYHKAKKDGVNIEQIRGLLDTDNLALERIDRLMHDKGGVSWLEPFATGQEVIEHIANKWNIKLTPAPPSELSPVHIEILKEVNNACKYVPGIWLKILDERLRAKWWGINTYQYVAELIDDELLALPKSTHELNGSALLRITAKGKRRLE